MPRPISPFTLKPESPLLRSLAALSFTAVTGAIVGAILARVAQW